MRCAYPSDLAQVAEAFDATYLERLKRVADAAETISADHGGADIILRRIRLPVHRGGMGIRSVAATSTPAFIAGACAAVPAFTDMRKPNAARAAASANASETGDAAPGSAVDAGII